MVKRSEVTNIAMSTGGEKKHSTIIVGEEVWQWVGIGWITVRDKATKSDLKTYPKLED